MASKAATAGLLLYCAGLVCIFFHICIWVNTRRLTFPSYPDLFEFRMAVLFSIPLTIVHRLFQKLFLSVAVMVIVKKDKWSKIVYESKLSRFGSAVFKFVFFVVFSVYSYKFALADAEWMPPQLGGAGTLKNCWGLGHAGDTQQSIGEHVTRFYHIALAYHVSELIFQVVYEHEKPDFTEMFLHHVTTCFLLLASFYGNFVRIGSLVLFLHYVSDIPVYGAKIFVDTRCKIVTFLFLIGMLVSWGWLRLYVFPVHIIKSVVQDCTLERQNFDDYPYVAFIVALSLLVVLHYYWYYLFLNMGWGYIYKGETKDTQANLSFMDTKTAKLQQKKE